MTDQEIKIEEEKESSFNEYTEDPNDSAEEKLWKEWGAWIVELYLQGCNAKDIQKMILSERGVELPLKIIHNCIRYSRNKKEMDIEKIQDLKSLFQREFLDIVIEDFWDLRDKINKLFNLLEPKIIEGNYKVLDAYLKSLRLNLERMDSILKIMNRYRENFTEMDETQTITLKADELAKFLKEKENKGEIIIVKKRSLKQKVIEEK